MRPFHINARSAVRFRKGMEPHIERELRGRPELATHSSFFFIGPIKDKASHAIRNNLRS